MKSKIFSYEAESLTVTWDQKRCIHAEACVHGLPDVFDPDRRPWIDPDQASSDAIEDIVMQCPTGALHVQRDGMNPEAAPSSNEITVDPDGPLILRGDIELLDAEGETLLRDTRVALCRCGLSANKPLCDGSHDGTFHDTGALNTMRLSETDTKDDTLHIQTASNGPLLVRGTVTITGADGQTCGGSKGALCRCGASESKPFCDGSHTKIDFSDT